MKPLTLPTSKMAEILGVSVDFLNKNKGILFFEGVHYNTPRGRKNPLWVVEEMEKWALNKEPISEKAQKVLDTISF